MKLCTDQYVTMYRISALAIQMVEISLYYFTMVMTISIGDFLSVSLYELPVSPSAPFPKYFL